MARSFAERYKWALPLVVDGMDNAFAKTYGAWPERFFIAHGTTIMLMGQPTTEFGYDRSDIEEHLRVHVGMAGEAHASVRDTAAASIMAAEERKTADSEAATKPKPAEPTKAPAASDARRTRGPRVASSLARVDAIMATAPTWKEAPRRDGEEPPAPDA